MATTLPSDMKVYDPQTQAGFTETLVQNTEAFNASSNGAITVSTNRKPGDYDYEAFFTNVSSLVTRQDKDSDSAATPLKLGQDETISVKLSRKIGPLDVSRGSMIKAGLNPNAFRFVAGQQAAKAVTVEMLNTGLSAGVAALANQADVLNDISGAGTIDTSTGLIDGLAKFGDASDNIVMFVMHSKVYFDLVKDQIAEKIDGISNFNIAEARPVTANRPVLVTDSADLVVSGSPDNYFTLGLTAGAIEIEDTEEEYIAFDEITGNEVIINRMQGEFAYNLGVKGFKWDVASGGANPNAAAIATGSNWDKVFTSHKDLGGIVIRSQ